MSIKGRTGFYTVTPIDDLRITALRIATAIGLDFTEDLSGKYEEFPAFVGIGRGWNLVLLGNPDPNYNLKDSPGNDFELQVSIEEDSEEFSSTEKIDEFIVRKLCAKDVCAVALGWGT